MLVSFSCSWSINRFLVSVLGEESLQLTYKQNCIHYYSVYIITEFLCVLRQSGDPPHHFPLERKYLWGAKSCPARPPTLIIGVHPAHEHTEAPADMSTLYTTYKPLQAMNRILRRGAWRTESSERLSGKRAGSFPVCQGWEINS